MSWAVLWDFSLWLFLNATVLLGLLQAVVMLDQSRQEDIFSHGRVASGMLAGCVGILLIRFGFTLVPGAVFDARSVVLAISGLFLGGLPTLIAMALTAVYRAMLGGPGAIPGVAIIVASGLLGLAWRRGLGRPAVEIGWGQLYALGLVVHGVMLVLLLLLPWEQALQVLPVVSLPVMLVLPLLTLAGGAVLIHAQRRQQGEVSLREERGRLANILWGTGVGTWEWNVKTGAFRINERWAEILGYRLDELAPVSIDTWTRLVHPDDLAHSEALLARHLAGETDAYECEARMRHLDGHWVWILDRGRVVSRDAAGQPEWMAGTHTDISGIKAGIEELRKLSMAVEQSPDSIVITDTDARIEYVNQRFVDITGYAREEVIGRNPRILQSGETPAALYEEMWATLLRGETWIGELHNRRKDGSEYVELAIISPIVQADGRVSHYVAVKDDTSELKAITKSLAIQARRTAAMLELPGAAEQLDERAFMQHVLGIMEDLTGSRIAFMHIVGEDQDTLELAAWSAATLGNFCRAAYDSHYPVSEAGIWAEALRQRAPVIFNDYAAYPDKRGLPEGHAELFCLVSVPVLSDGRVRLLFGVGNKDGAYTDTDVETLRLLADETWRLVDRRRSEHALRQSEERSRRVLDNMPDMLFINHGDRVTYVNRAGVRLMKADSADELQGRSIYDLFAPDYHPLIRQRIARLRAAPGVSVEPEREDLLARDGTLVEAEVGATSFIVPGGVDVEVIVRDVGARLNAERELQESSRRYVEEMTLAVLGTADAVSRVIELRDPYTAGHERRVGELAAAIAQELGLDEQLQRGLRIAGAMHDVGKVIVPVEILSKPTRLNAAEFELIKLHAEQGYQILKDVSFPWPVAEVARQHHERMDGSGYPRGLKGEAILLEARILAVADVVESMASHRPYRPAVGLEPALEEIERNAGRLYDTAAAAACLRLFRERSWDFSG